MVCGCPFPGMAGLVTTEFPHRRTLAPYRMDLRRSICREQASDFNTETDRVSRRATEKARMALRAKRIRAPVSRVPSRGSIVMRTPGGFDRSDAGRLIRRCFHHENALEPLAVDRLDGRRFIIHTLTILRTASREWRAFARYGVDTICDSHLLPSCGDRRRSMNSVALGGPRSTSVLKTPACLPKSEPGGTRKLAHGVTPRRLHERPAAGIRE
jgi:hypothetical protein